MRCHHGNVGCYLCEREVAELRTERAAVRALVDALPRCTCDGLHDEGIAEATHAEPLLSQWYCDECCDGTESHELPYAPQLRNLLEVLK